MSVSHLSHLQSAMTAGFAADAILVTSEINQRYLTGFPITDGYVLATAKKGFLITDFRYIEAAKAKVNTEDFDILMPKNMMDAIGDILTTNRVTVIAIEESTLSVADLAKLEKRFPAVKFVAGASALIDGLRLYKDEEEIASMQKAQDLADAAFTHILDYIKPDMTEIDVALELEFAMRRGGAEGTSFDTIAISGSASSCPHGVPRNVKLEKGFLTMDYGCKVNGYCSDMTRTVVLGRADTDMKKLYATVLDAQLSSLAACKEGANCKALDKIARDIIDKNGFAGTFGHSLGHGVGLYIHEQPRLSFAAPEDSVLKRGHVVTFEPGIYLEGKYGCRIEDMVAILPDGTVHNFTHSRKDLIELF